MSVALIDDTAQITPALVDTNEWWIGRSRRCHLRLRHHTVSARHARIIYIDQKYYLEDTGSKNGTFVNDHPVRTHQLQEGDTIRLAIYTFRFTEYFEQPIERSTDVPTNASALIHTQRASIQQHNGADSGLTSQLTEKINIIGNTTQKVVIIHEVLHNTAQYYLAPLESTPGMAWPTLNGRSLPKNGELLVHGDQIKVAGTHLQFYHSHDE